MPWWPQFRSAATALPIIDERLQIIGWTTVTPEIWGTNIRHAGAEDLLGGPIKCAYVELTNVSDAIVAGAPSNWAGPWRCLAILRQGTTGAGTDESEQEVSNIDFIVTGRAKSS